MEEVNWSSLQVEGKAEAAWCPEARHGSTTSAASDIRVCQSCPRAILHVLTYFYQIHIQIPDKLVENKIGKYYKSTTSKESILKTTKIEQGSFQMRSDD